MCPPDASQGCKIVPETLTANQMLVKAARLSQKPLQQMLDNSATSIADTDTDKDGLVSRGSFSKFIDMAASIPRMYGYAPTDAELYETEDEEEQAGREMFDSMDLKGTGVITVDEWLKFCMEHIIAKAATLAAHPILVHGSMEVFKAFVNAVLVIGSPEHMEMFWFLLGLFTESDPDEDGIVMPTDFSAMMVKALESPKSTPSYYYRLLRTACCSCRPRATDWTRTGCRSASPQPTRRQGTRGSSGRRRRRK